MKISVIIIILLFVNTTALFAETIGKLMKELNILGLVIIEATLIISYYINSVLKDVRKVSKIDLSNLKLFVVKGKKSA